MFCECISHLLAKEKPTCKNVIDLFCVFFFLFDFFNTSEPPKDDGGAEITKYVVELSQGLSGMWEMLLVKDVLSFILKVTRKQVLLF